MVWVTPGASISVVYKVNLMVEECVLAVRLSATLVFTEIFAYPSNPSNLILDTLSHEGAFETLMLLVSVTAFRILGKYNCCLGTLCPEYFLYEKLAGDGG